MSLILAIDTAQEEASVCISEESNVISMKKNNSQMDHAAWIQMAIREMLSESGRNMNQLSAVAVTEGPGSYTGLRVGMSTAKGLCYSLNIPLITVNTLFLIAQRVKTEIALNNVYPFPVLICPMIDARRMEVFTTLYDLDLSEQMQPAAIILDENAFKNELQSHVIIFCGSGSKKWQNLCKDTNAVFVEVTQNVTDFAEKAFEKYKTGAFSDVAYAEPTYLKNVYTGKNK